MINIHKIIAENTVRVVISNGVINGRIETSVDGKQLNVFRGIPYAKAPVDQLRFRKPVPIEPWDQPINAFEFKSACIQNPIILYTLNGMTDISEDCLHLNIWSPVESNDSIILKPVMFFIHGGSFMIGGASETWYNFEEIAAHGDVTFVSINYRLNTFGFLYTGTADAPGNVGLLDQTLALEWVNDNIRYFGGDPEQITIFGQSAGSMATSLHILSPLSRNLFKNAIMNSGAYVNSHMNGNNEEHIKRWLRGVEAIGCTDGESKQDQFTSKMIECLRSCDPVLLASIPDMPQLKPGSVKWFWPVVVDGEFLPKPPLDMIKSGDIKRNANIMISTTGDEGSTFLQFNHDPLTYNYIFPVNFTFFEAKEELLRISSQLSSKVAINGKQVSELYFTGLSDSNDFDVLRRTIGIAIGDYYFTCPALEFAKQIFKNSEYKANIYQYLYNSKTPEFFACGKWMGVCHGSDVTVMFGNTFLNLDKYSDKDRNISKQLIHILTEFAKTGSPPSQRGAKWPKYYTIDDHIIAPYYEITSEPKLNTNFDIGFKVNECEYLWNKYLY